MIFLHFLRVVTDRKSHEATFHFGHLSYTPLKLHKIVFITEIKINCNFAKTWGCVWRLRGYNSMLFHINIVMVLHIIIQNYQANEFRKLLQYGKLHVLLLYSWYMKDNSEALVIRAVCVLPPKLLQSMWPHHNSNKTISARTNVLVSIDSCLSDVILNQMHISLSFISSTKCSKAGRYICKGCPGSFCW